MIYLVSGQKSLFETDAYKELDVKDSIEILESWDELQFDTETSGRNPHACKLLCMQFGNIEGTIQIVVDLTTIDIQEYRNILESKVLIGHNLKFDLSFLYNHNIKPLNVYDTMIIEQLLHLGYDNKTFRYSLKAVAERRLGIDIDKTTRGEIIWRGLDEAVVKYAAGDVEHLNKIKVQQEQEMIQKQCVNGGILENAFVPVIAYLEWCGIKLDIDLWHKKMAEDQKELNQNLEALNNWLINYAKDHTEFNKYLHVNLQGSLFDGFDTKPYVILNWSSSTQLIPFVQMLGFDTKTTDKKSGESKDSVVEKLLKKQKGICDDFLKLYLAYQEKSKACSTYGQNYIDAINPNTGRIHTVFKQLGAASGRMSCGDSKNNDLDLAKLKGISPSRCKYVQLQNLPANEITRSSFVAEKGNIFCSCDYSALESRLGADIYNEHEMLREFLEGSGDMHSLCAKLVFHEELKDISVKDIADKRPDLRKKVKPIEFSQQFGGGPRAVADALGCSFKEAKVFVDAYANGFKGIAEFKRKGSKFVRANGYVLICKKTGHKLYWQDWDHWKEIEESPTRDYEYTKEELRTHNMAAAKWDRMALNAPTQGSGIIILKHAMVMFYRWIIQNNLWNKVLLCDLVHDEVCIECPEEIKDTVIPILVKCMEKAASVYCTKLPIPAKPEVGNHWIH